MKATLSLAALLTLTTLGFNANAQWQSSNTNCAAYTDCYATNAYGQSYFTGRISCQVYGSAYAYGAAYSSNACTWYVQPNQSVQCSGYIQTTNAYGQTVWGWQNYAYQCPRY